VALPCIVITDNVAKYLCAAPMVACIFLPVMIHFDIDLLGKQVLFHKCHCEIKLANLEIKNIAPVVAFNIFQVWMAPCNALVLKYITFKFGACFYFGFRRVTVFCDEFHMMIL